ncbi:hypothetical protein FAZ69_15180 [Trinickia terrae]|uniref:Uncharacterized protein n=1 Tax=Trinickia terrae TaxID=2571161 RepID=A0A4U1I375_9BURK|nr:hypothetical protein [Trinickia terrae]TKC87642.1 hypothetical protein FAZ69_15180 [Trinickia terrae]
MSSAFTSLIPDSTDSNGNPTSWSPEQVAALTATSMMLGGTAAGLLGQNAEAGATAAENETLNNRMLHPQEQPLAQQLAAAANAKGITNLDGSPVTAANVSNQLAQMGYSQNGTSQSGAAATVEGAIPPNDGTTWAKAGVDASTGQTIWTQVTGAPNPALQSFIIQTTNGADVPSFANTYTASPSGALSNTGSQGISIGSTAGSICPNGNCGVANGSVTLPSQQQVADGVGNVSNQLGVVSATAAAVAAANGGNPAIAEPAATFSVGTAVASYALGGVQQLLSPNVGQYATESGPIGLLTYYAGDRYPFFAPLITQVGNMLPDSKSVSDFENLITSKWNSLLGRKRQ